MRVQYYYIFRRIAIATSLLLVSLPSWSQKLARVSPESQGVHSADVQVYLDHLMQLSTTTMHGAMVLRHGKVIAEAYNAPFKAVFSHTLYSASKTFTAAAVGLCVGDSLMSVNDQVAQYFLDELPQEYSDTLLSLTVENLLTMQSGLPVRYTQLRKDSVHWARALLSQPFLAEPGSLFAYDSMDTYLLSAIVQRVSGKTVHELLKERIFGPLQIPKSSWELSPDSVSCGGWGLYLQLESMAKFGQLLLQNGRWNGEQLIPEWWVRDMMSQHAQNANGTGYGYQVWMTSMPGVVRIDGAYGQHVFIIPEQDMVVAIFQNFLTGSGINPGGDEWMWLCQLMRKVSDTRQPIVAGQEYKTLQEKSSSYHLPYAGGEALSAKHQSLLSIPTTVSLADNMLGWERIVVSQSRERLKLNVTTRNGENYDIVCGHGQWQTSKIKGQPLIYPDRKFLGQCSGIQSSFYVGASYGWYGSSNDDLYVRLHYVNWISSARIHLHFTGNVVSSVRLRPAYTNKEIEIPILNSYTGKSQKR